VVVAGQQQDPAVRCAAGEVAVAEHVARAVDPRALAVPHGKDPVVGAVAEQAALLAAPDRGGREVLVDPRLEVDLVALEERPGPPQLLVQRAQGRAPVARDEAGGVQARCLVAPALHHGQARQGLGAGQEHLAVFEGVFVVERYGCKCHEVAFARSPRNPVRTKGNAARARGQSPG
jgi:hypothetical protein